VTSQAATHGVEQCVTQRWCEVPLYWNYEILLFPLKHFLMPYDFCCHIWCRLWLWIVSSPHGFLVCNTEQNEKTWRVLSLIMIMILQNQSFLLYYIPHIIMSITFFFPPLEEKRVLDLHVCKTTYRESFWQQNCLLHIQDDSTSLHWQTDLIWLSAGISKIY
jgi:hypothetical protein